MDRWRILQRNGNYQKELSENSRVENATNMKNSLNDHYRVSQLKKSP